MVATVNSRSSAKRRVNSTSSLARLLAATGRLATMDAGGAFAWEYLAGTDLKSALDYPNGARTEYTYESGRDLLTNVRNAKGGTVYSNSPYNIYKEFVWDPTESVATKPLCFRQHNQADAYLMHDGNKNVTDVERIARPRKNFSISLSFSSLKFVSTYRGRIVACFTPLSRDDRFSR